MSAGRVIDSGTYDELALRKKMFKKMAAQA
jgi:hypothetical protein